MNKQDMMSQFTNLVGNYIAKGWVISPNNTSISGGVVNIKLQREGELHTLRITEKSELTHDMYTFEIFNELMGETLVEQQYYYLWDWRRRDEDNHKVVETLEWLEI